MTSYEPAVLVRDARARYFAENGLADGGYADRWVVLRAAGVPIAVFPNTRQRVRSVRIHDVHHLLTGYDTSWTGEAEIAAWELASGCCDHYAARALNLGAMLIGIVIAPRAVWRAFARGRASRNLYGGEWNDGILDRTLGELRRELGLV